MATLFNQKNAGDVLSQCDNHATSTAGERRQQYQRGEPRFAVVTSNDGETFELWLFDKEQQSDEIQRVSIPITPGADLALGAIIVAWQLTGEVPDL